MGVNDVKVYTVTLNGHIAAVARLSDEEGKKLDAFCREYDGIHNISCSEWDEQWVQTSATDAIDAVKNEVENW